MTDLLGKLSLEQQNELQEKGLTSSKISEYLEKYQGEQKGYISTLGIYYTKPFIASKFIAYALEQNEKEKEIMNDLNLFPPKPNNSTKPNNSSIPNELMGDKEKESQPNYLLYGLIGLGVIVGAFLIFKKK